MGRAGRRLDVGAVRRPGDAGALRGEPGRHVPLPAGGPGVVFLAVQHEHRDAARRERGRLVLGLEQLSRHGDQAGRVVREHALLEEGEDGGVDPGRRRLRLEHAGPELSDLGAQVGRRGAVQVVQHEVELLGPRAGKPGGSGAQQGERGRRAAAEDGFADDEAAERMAEQVGRLHGVHEGRDVRAEFTGFIGVRVVRAGRLVLAALVDRDDPAASRGELTEDRDEIFLAAGVAGHEQRRAPLAGTGGGQRVEHGELAACRLHGGPPRSLGQLKRGRRRHFRMPAVRSPVGERTAPRLRQHARCGCGAGVAAYAARPPRSRPRCRRARRLRRGSRPGRRT